MAFFDLQLERTEVLRVVKQDRIGEATKENFPLVTAHIDVGPRQSMGTLSRPENVLFFEEFNSVLGDEAIIQKRIYRNARREKFFIAEAPLDLFQNGGRLAVISDTHQTTIRGATADDISPFRDPVMPDLLFVGLPQRISEISDDASSSRRDQSAPLIGYRREPVSRIEEYIVTAAIFWVIGYLAYLALKRET